MDKTSQELMRLANLTPNDVRVGLRKDLEVFAQSFLLQPPPVIVPQSLEVQDVSTTLPLQTHKTAEKPVSTDAPGPAIIITCVFNGGKTDVGFPGAFTILPP